MRYTRFVMAIALELRRELEVRMSQRHVGTARARALYDGGRIKGEFTLGTLGNPVAQGRVVRVRIGLDLRRLGHDLDESGRHLCRHVSGRGRGALAGWCGGRLCRANDDAALIDPDAAWDIDDAECRGEHVMLIDERRVLGLGGLDEPSATLCTEDVQPYADDLQALWV